MRIVLSQAPEFSTVKKQLLERGRLLASRVSNLAGKKIIPFDAAEDITLDLVTIREAVQAADGVEELKDAEDHLLKIEQGLPQEEKTSSFGTILLALGIGGLGIFFLTKVLRRS